MKTSSFAKSISSICLDDVFNPYSDTCPAYDLPDAAKIRRSALSRLVTAASTVEIDSIWIGRDLGYRGGRRTGLALTDEIHLNEHGRRWGLEIPRATSGVAIAERTAGVIWDALSQIKSNVFLWNVFPLHPHEPGSPFTNRLHTRRERAIGEELLNELISHIRPKRLISIGNDAYASAMKLAGDREVLRFRHPSYGGQGIFMKQMQDCYGVLSNKAQPELF